MALASDADEEATVGGSRGGGQQTGASVSDLNGGVFVYENDHLMFSGLRERKIRFALVWKAWMLRCVRITADGILSYARPKVAAADPLNQKCPAHKQFLLDDIEVSLMADEDMGQSNAVEYGLVVKCHTLDHIESYFRCIVAESELEELLAAMKRVARTHNIDKIPRSELQTKKKTQRMFILRSQQSVMRRAVTRAMDRHDRSTKRDHILAKRGAFRALPVAMSNDLIHGSWWFVWGSVGVIITAAVVINNQINHEFNDDDSNLSKHAFLASWVLMLLSGLFSMLGSLAFVRAFHEDPPMAPLFSWYHVQSDELLASWLFFLACIPFAPYVLIFLSSGYNGLIYLVALAFAIIAALGCLLFVRACYPSDKTHRDLLLPLSRFFCCFCTPQTREYFFMNDWLGGSWFFYWGSAFVTFVAFVLFLVEAANGDRLQMWIMGTSFLESAFFLVGSAYFVAGSFPESYVRALHGEVPLEVSAGDDSSRSLKPDATLNHFLAVKRSNNYEKFQDEDDVAEV